MQANDRLSYFPVVLVRWKEFDQSVQAQRYCLPSNVVRRRFRTDEAVRVSRVWCALPELVARDYFPLCVPSDCSLAVVFDWFCIPEKGG
jgi:hypothetical protein